MTVFVYDVRLYIFLSVVPLVIAPAPNSVQYTTEFEKYSIAVTIILNATNSN